MNSMIKDRVLRQHQRVLRQAFDQILATSGSVDARVMPPSKTAKSAGVSAGGWMLVDGARGGKQILGANGWEAALLWINL